MKAIINGDGSLDSIVFDTAGHDLTGRTVIDPVPQPVHSFQWDRASQSFVPRPPTPAEDTHAALEADPRWAALRSASPQQVSDWMTVNVTDLASARRVLTILVLAVQHLARTR